jgi:hypothetical protein
MTLRAPICLVLVVALGAITNLSASREPHPAPATMVYRLDQPGPVSLAIYESAWRRLRTLLTRQKQDSLLRFERFGTGYRVSEF